MQQKRQELINKAREWLGTPWAHNQACKGVGVDCLQFVRAIALSMGIDHADGLDNYSRTPNSNVLLLEFEKRFKQKNILSIEPADVILFRFAGLPHHVGLSTKIGIIHASFTAKRVVEHAYDDFWQKRTIAVFDPFKPING